MKIKWLAGAGLAVCAFAAQAQVPGEQAAGWLGSPNALEEIRRCVPSATAAQLDRWRASGSAAGNTFHDRPAARFLGTSGQVWACFGLSPEGFPVIPLWLLEHAIQPKGVARDKLDVFYRELQGELARSGYAKGLSPMDGSRRLTLHVSVDQGPTTLLNVRTATVEAASINEADFKPVLADKPQSFLTRGGRDGQASSMLSGLLPQRPMRGEYLRVEGTPETVRREFAGTTWRSLTAPSSSVTFEPGGVAVFRTKANTSFGKWAREGDALYFENRNFYQSGALRTMESVTMLDTETRRPASIQPGMPRPGSTQPTPPTELSEFHGRGTWFPAADKEAAAVVQAIWQRYATVVRDQVENQRQVRLREAEGPDWSSGTKMLSLCGIAILGRVNLVADLDNVKEGDVCRSFIGTRRAWQAVLSEGCNGRCLPMALPSTE